MKELVREMLVSHDSSETRVAVVEDGALVELRVERPRRSSVGNVYMGTVTDVLPGMQAAFVDIGLNKNAYLFVDDLVVDGRNPRGRDITGLVKVGQKLMVQVIKDPMGTKGARVTTDISLPGRFLVLMPKSETFGVSKKLPEDERERLQTIVGPLVDRSDMGLIARTVAREASARDLESDFEFLMRLWRRVERQSADALAPEIVYSEIDLALRMVRDVFTESFKRLVVDDKATYEKIVSFAKKSAPQLAKRIVMHKGDVPLFSAYGVDTASRTALSRTVTLPNGSYIVIDRTEALTVVDVNTGRYTGRRSLEETAFLTNLEAADEIARQLRLRDIGGIVVVDFIDMESSEHREAVIARMEQALQRDRTRTRVGEFSKFGLLEITRKNQEEGLFESLTDRCPHCDGEGRIMSDETVRISVERTLRSILASGKQQAYLIGLHPDTHEALTRSGRNFEAVLRGETGKNVRVVPDPSIDVPTDVKVLIEGRPGD